MFDLETKILEWRKQMLSAGIKNPVPLDELECHLRERIYSLKAGLSEANAFQTAAKELGDGKILRKEFSKGRLIWRLRKNPVALNILGGWFILGGVNNLCQLIWLWRADRPWENVSAWYWTAVILAFASLQLPVGIGLLSRGKFWRYCALAFTFLCIISAAWDVVNKLHAPPGWAAPGNYFMLMGMPVPTRFEVCTDLLNLCLLVWGIYVLTKSSARDLFRPAAAN